MNGLNSKLDELYGKKPKYLNGKYLYFIDEFYHNQVKQTYLLTEDEKFDIFGKDDKEGNFLFFNKLGIEDREKLDEIECLISATNLAKTKLQKFEVDDFLYLHQKAFEDIYTWAGQLRIMDISKPEPEFYYQSAIYSPWMEINYDLKKSIDCLNKVNTKDAKNFYNEFGKAMSSLWRTHAFPEGNTRVAVNFCLQYAESHGCNVDYDFVAKNAYNIRCALAKDNLEICVEDRGEFNLQKLLYQVVKLPDGLEKTVDYEFNDLNYEKEEVYL